MISREEVKNQLKSIGVDFQFFGRSAVRELPKILFEKEKVNHAVFGRYSGGYAVLFATNQRVLLIDKKPLYLTIEDVRYDMISDMMFNNRLLTTSLMLGTVHKSITFVAYNHHSLRELCTFVQKRVMDYRQQQTTHHENNTGLYEAYDIKDQDSQNPIPFQPPAMSPYKNPVVIKRRVSKIF